MNPSVREAGRREKTKGLHTMTDAHVASEVLEPLVRTEPQASQVLAHVLGRNGTLTCRVFSGLLDMDLHALRSVTPERSHRVGRSDILLEFASSTGDDLAVGVEVKLADLIGVDQEERESGAADRLVVVALGRPRDANTGAVYTTWHDLLKPYDDYCVVPLLLDAVTAISNQPRVAARLSLEAAFNDSVERLRSEGLEPDERPQRAKRSDLYVIVADVEAASPDLPEMWLHAEVSHDGTATVMLAVAVDGDKEEGFFPAHLALRMWSSPEVTRALEAMTSIVSRHGSNKACEGSPIADPERVRLRRLGVPTTRLIGYRMLDDGWAGYGCRLKMADGGGFRTLIDDTAALMLAMRASLQSAQTAD